MSIVRQESVAQAKTLATRAFNLLDEWAVPANPQNYAVAYEISRGQNSALIHSLENLLNNGSKPDNYCLEQWQLKFLAGVQPEQEKLMRGLSFITAKLKQDLDGSDHSVSEFIKQLDAGLQDLKNEQSDETENSVIISVIKNLVTASQTALAEQNLLLEKLQTSQAQTTKLKHQLTVIRQKAYTDNLTGLLNRHGLDTYIDKIKQRCRLSALVIDIDHFKRINDDFGHPVGDQVLVQVAKQLQQHKPANTKAVRYGGEEFILLFDDTDLKAVLAVAEAIRQKISKLKFIVGKQNRPLPQITVSMGFAKQQSEETFNQVLMRADKALYQAKNNGRNQVCCALS
ncbi:GGDEF domain-containing protein [Gayadomonas joobiniege]|uniref:GGDEF domain-containing protein n=1 Tax=Gayadomonas joobiniege TaxID=1234606 RepID=UPI00037F9712|nr:GGDEF domain-containing protein [Gayadomonas joobiniege]